MPHVANCGRIQDERTKRRRKLRRDELLTAMTPPRAVVIHAGARDSYQVAQALHDAGLLEALSTNVYSEGWATRKYGARVPNHLVHVSAWGFLHYWFKRLWNNWTLERASDRAIGRLGGSIAAKKDVPVVAYSYYASAAFAVSPPVTRSKILFQLHPHPLSVRRLLSEELELVPAARESLLQEAELSLSPAALDELSQEPRLADAIIVASSYTKQTLIENGHGQKPISVVPYGVDASRFPRRQPHTRPAGPLRIIWLGQVCQRKGLSYLLDAVRRVSKQNVQVLLRGHGRVAGNLLAQYSDLKIDLQSSLPRAEIIRDLHASDLFVLPSLVEGFGHSIIEAMSCGLPVLTTNHTCGADLITPGESGFLVPIRDSEAIAQQLDWALTHREELAAVGENAAAAIAPYTWDRFRRGVVEAYSSVVDCASV